MMNASQTILRPPRVKRDSRSEPELSWMDDLAICADSGVGFATNQHYRTVTHGLRHQSHGFEDKSVYLRFSPDMCFYGLFDGNDGDQASSFAAQRLPAEVLFEAVKVIEDMDRDKELDERKCITELIKKSFKALEASFFESDTSKISDILAERSALLLAVQDKYSSSINRARQERPDLVKRLTELNQLIMCGTTAAVALIYHDVVYVANCGDSRTLMVTKPKNAESDFDPIVKQLSKDHTLANPDELNRIRALGVDIALIHQNDDSIVNQRTTRCIGNYFVKAGHKEFDAFKRLKVPPVSFEPDLEIHQIDENSQFFVLMSYGLYNAYMEVLLATSELGEHEFDERANKDIVKMIFEELKQQSTLCGVTQTVVDRIGRLHHDLYLNSMSEVRSSTFDHVEDMTLLVRNLNFPFKGSIAASDNKLKMAKDECQELSKEKPSAKDREMAFGHIDEIVKVKLPYMISDERRRSLGQSLAMYKGNGREPSSDTNLNEGRTSLDKDSEGKIEAYVDFSSFYKNMEKATRKERSAQ